MAAKIVNISQAKQHLQLSHEFEDALLEMMLESAETFVERYCGLKFHSGDTVAEHTEHLDGDGIRLWVRARPLLSVVSITDRITSSVFDETVYSDNYSIWRQYEDIWTPGIQRWQVVMTSGYTEATTPVDLKLAIYDLMYRWQRVRGGTEVEQTGAMSVSWGALMSSDLQAKLKSVSKRLPIS